MIDGILNAVALHQQALNPSARSALKRSFLVYAGLVLLIGWAYAAWYIAAERARAMELARHELSIASSALAAEVEAMLGNGLRSADAAFRHLQQEEGVALDSDRVIEQLEQDLTGPDYVRGLFISDATRTVVVGRNGYRLNLQGQPAWLTDSKAYGNFRVGTSIPHPAESTRHIVPIAVAKPDVTGQSVSVGFWLGVEELNRRYRRLGVEESVIALIRLDGAAVVYTSNSGIPDPAALQKLRTSALFRRMRDADLPAFFEGVSSVDGQRKIFVASRVSHEIPLIISVSREIDSIMAGWYRSATKVVWLALGSSIVLIALTALFYRFIWEINRRETQFQQLLENSLASILMIKNGRVVACNNTAARVFRMTEGRTLGGLTPAEFCPAHQPDGTSSQEALMRLWEDLVKRGAITFRWVFKHLDDGSPFEADVHLSAIQIADDTITLAIVHDISELERARCELQEANINLEFRVAQRTRELESANVRLAAANLELEQFSASASHDLRSPLGAISGQAGMLELELGNALGIKGKERLRKIGAAVKHASDVVEGLLSLARITRQDLQQEKVSLSCIAEQVIAELKGTEPTRKVVCRIEPDMWVNADSRLMHSLLTNVLTNAWKYSSDKPQTSIDVGRQLQRGEVIYSISDNGVGFDIAHADKIFQAFERLPSRRQFSGVGLGLAIVARIVARYGGHVWARSEEGLGATFYFTLPLAQETEMQALASLG